MPISIKDGITDETWTVLYDCEELQLTVKNSTLPHQLFVANKEGFKSRHPWEISFRFLNEIVWFYGTTVRGFNGGHGEFCANMDFSPDSDDYALRLEEFEQKITSRDQHLALGFFREGISSESPYYRFICFAKILEIPFSDGSKKRDWIEQEIPNLKGKASKLLRDRRLDILDGKTLSNWIKEEGRDAVSHGRIRGTQTVRDPNSIRDWDDVVLGNEVMKELAEKIIIEQLEVPKTTVIWTN